jgi:pimeloyl-ACP methyl ester carboxylesterase
MTVCFHGFLEDASSFVELSDQLPGHTLIAIDLPFHGRTNWREGLSLGVQEWISIIAQCPEIGDRNYGIIGYSMGGKMALTVYQARPEKVPFLWLIAPDGLKPDPWHHFATRTTVGHAIMRYNLRNPSSFMRLLDMLEKSRVINGSIAKFVRYYMQDEAMREKVYQTWMTFRDFRPEADKIRQQIRQNKTEVSMVFGRYDKLCPASRGLAFAEGMPTFVRMKTMQAGHLLMRPHHLKELAKALTGRKHEPVVAEI